MAFRTAFRKVVIQTYLSWTTMAPKGVAPLLRGRNNAFVTLALLILTSVSSLQPDPEAIRQHVQHYVKDQNLGDKEAILIFGVVAIPVLYEERRNCKGARSIA